MGGLSNCPRLLEKLDQLKSWSVGDACSAYLHNIGYVNVSRFFRTISNILFSVNDGFKYFMSTKE
jgi:hypothetical protein